MITSLTGCSGCISTLMSLDIFPQFFERTKIQYFPFISDANVIEECDVALIEGCISEEFQITYVKEVRRFAKKIYALGSCAALGGILSLSSKKKAEPLSKYVEIEGFIPGCPTPSKLLGNCLINLIEKREFVLSQKNMCASCPLRGENEFNFNVKITKMTNNSNNSHPIEEDSECFLKRGILCLGPITRDGCDYNCIKYGIACEGCMGPISKSFTSNIVNYLSLFNISKELRKYKGVFYRFAKPNLWK